METENKFDRYFSGHPMGDEIDPRKQKKKNTIIVYKTNWHYILAAAAGGAFAVLLFNHITREGIDSSGII